jgi:integrase
MAILAECPICHRKQSNKNKICKCREDLDQAKRSRRVRYWIHYQARKQQFREPVGYSIEEARDAEGKRRSQKRENRVFKKLPEIKMTFQELSDWYIELATVKALAYYEILKYNLSKFNAEFGDKIITDILPSSLQNFQAKLNKTYSESYIDKIIGAAKAVINKAYDDKLVSLETKETFRKIGKLLKRNANARDKVLTFDEYQAIMKYLPQHLKPVFTMGYYTGMRKGEILNLKWNRVKLKTRMIHLRAEDTKDKEARSIPLSDELCKILKNIPPAIHDDHVFLYKGKPFKDIRSGLKDACKQAGIPYGRNKKDGFTFHDLRHTFNTCMRKAGVKEGVIMKITGHSTREMFDRYDTKDEEDLKNAVKSMGLFLQNLDQNLNTGNKNSSQEES